MSSEQKRRDQIAEQRAALLNAQREENIIRLDKTAQALEEHGGKPGKFQHFLAGAKMGTL